jgi:hypothetical protein
MSKQAIADKVAVNFCMTKENLDNLKECIASGTLAEAVRAARQLEYQAQRMRMFLENLGA